MVILIDAEKSFDKIQYPSMIKTLTKVGIEEVYLNTKKGIYMISAAERRWQRSRT